MKYFSNVLILIRISYLEIMIVLLIQDLFGSTENFSEVLLWRTMKLFFLAVSNLRQILVSLI